MPSRSSQRLARLAPANGHGTGPPCWAGSEAYPADHSEAAARAAAGLWPQLLGFPPFPAGLVSVGDSLGAWGIKECSVNETAQLYGRHPKSLEALETLMETMIKTKQQLIDSPQQLRPHVVLLGAGASRAAFLHGDRASRQIPLMNDLVDIVGLKQEIQDTGESFENGHNFESIYSRLDSGSEPKHERAKINIEKKIEEYFSTLHLPDQATIYDHMLLSLRREDAVFTFNWDPFLFDAYERSHGIVPLPGIFFLHGNVRIGQCPKHNETWEENRTCAQIAKNHLSPCRYSTRWKRRATRKIHTLVKAGKRHNSYLKKH